MSNTSLTPYRFALPAAVLLLASLLLQGCSSPGMKQPAIDYESSPYGAWLLLNPKDYNQTLISGSLFVCLGEGEEKCNKNEATLVLLEKNTGNGCTDYVANGTVYFDHAQQQWLLTWKKAGNNGMHKPKLIRSDKYLKARFEDGSELIFLRSDKATISEKAKQACKKSLQKHIRSTR